MTDEMDIFSQGDSLLESIEVADTEDLEGDLTGKEKLPVDDVDDKEDKDIDKKDDLIEVDEVNEDGDDKDKDKASSTLEPKNTQSSKTDSSNTISSFVSALAAEGAFTLPEERLKEIKTSEDLYDAFQEEKEAYFQEQLNILPEDDYKQALAAVKSGIPVEQVLGHQSKQAVYSSITDASIEDESPKGEALRKQILMASFTSKGFNQLKAEKFTKQLIDSGDDVEEAKDALNDLKSTEANSFKLAQDNAIKQQSDAKEVNATRLKDFNTLVNSTKEIIPNQRLSTKMKKILYDGMTKGVGTVDGKNVDIIGKYLAEKGDEGRLVLSYIIELTNGGKNLDKLSTIKAKKEATKVFEQQLQNSSTSPFVSESGFQEEDLWNHVIG